MAHGESVCASSTAAEPTTRTPQSFPPAHSYATGTTSEQRASPGVTFDGSQLLDPPPESYSAFVNHFRTASPYIEGHRGRTFVLVIPSEVITSFHPAPISNNMDAQHHDRVIGGRVRSRPFR